MQISKISFNDSGFPDIPRKRSKPRQRLNALGILPKANLVALVETRKSTPIDEHVANQIACKLARTPAIIMDGQTRGIDTILVQVTSKACNLGAGQWVAT